MRNQPTYDELLQKVHNLEKTVSKYQQELTTLQSSENRYQNLFQHMLHEVHIWELVRDDGGTIKTWRLVDANPAALNSWGKRLPEIVGKKTDEIFPNTNATELFMPIVQKIFAEDKPHIWETPFSATGQTLQMVSIPLGEIFISTGIDITNIKRAENELRETVLKLTEAIKAGNVGLWDWDLITSRIYYSKEWKKQIGYDDEEISDSFEEWEKRVHPDDLEKTLQIINNSLDKASRSHETEFRFKHKDGSYRWILARASIVQDEDGRPVRMLGSHIDITERKQMEKTFSQKQKMEALGSLAGGIAHDFNNLLVPILGYTELAKKSLASNAKEFKYLENVGDAANRAKDLVQKILTINRGSLSKTEAIQLNDLVDEVLTVLYASLPKSIDIKEEIDFDLPPISADPSQIYQVILNLCTNAVQAMPDGGELSLRLNLVKKYEQEFYAQGQISTDFLCLHVQDNGFGMDSATLEHIYDPFFSTKEKDGQRGTGLGLSIVSSIVKQHEGHIEVESELGVGTVFHVYFPVLREESLSASVELEPYVVSGDEHILLIDDEKMVCDLSATTLKQLGYQVTACTNSETALKKFKVNPERFQLIITDYSMPKLTGPQLIKKIKGIRQDIPIILLTGYSNLASPERMQEFGCDGIVAKPYTSTTLGRAVRQVLAKNLKRRE